MNRLSFRWLLAVGLLVGAGRAFANDYVAVTAVRSSAYARTGSGTSAKPESYAFTPGKHIQGITFDKSESKFGFEDVAKILIPALAKQNYFPATKPTEADLLIVVHWGTTLTYEDPNRQQNLERLNEALSEYGAIAGAAGFADTEIVNKEIANLNGESMTENQYIELNAALLGYKRNLEKEQRKIFSSEEERSMRADLGEERYFVVLMAYDYANLRKTKQPRMLWVTHMSVRSPGNNFAAALPEMSKVASSVFGLSTGGLKRVETDTREGKVEIGDITIVSTSSEAPPPAKRSK